MSNGEKSRCITGISCGLTCISSLKRCLKDLPEGVQPGVSWARDEIQKRKERPKRGGGQSVDRDSIDKEKLRNRISQWRKENGLSDDASMQHDATHVLLRDYLGKSSEQIAGLLGGTGKGPSVVEEIMADVFSNMSRYSRRELKDYIDGTQIYINPTLKNDIERSIRLSENLGFVKPEDSISVNRDRVVRGMERLFKKVSERGDFEDFLYTVRNWPFAKG